MDEISNIPHPSTPLFEIIEDDIILILWNAIPSTQTVTLFDSANAITKGSIPTYTWTIPLSQFPVTNPSLVVNGSTYTYVGVSTVGSIAANLQTVLPVATVISGYTSGGSGGSLIGYTSSAVNVYGILRTTSLNNVPVITNTLGGTGVTVTLVNMDYNQFVSGLNMMGGFFFDTMDILASSIAQVSQPVTVTRFKDVFGTQFSEMVIPAQNLFANQNGALGIRIFMPADGNNTLTYSLLASETVTLVIKTRAFDTLKWLDPEMKHLETHDGSQQQGKMELVPKNRYYIAKDIIENETGMKNL